MKELILRYLDFLTKLTLYDDPFWRAAVVDHLSSSFNRALRLFTPSPLALRHHLRSSGAIITGDFALWFIQQFPHSWSPQILEIVVSPEHYTSFVGNLDLLDVTVSTSGPRRPATRALGRPAYLYSHVVRCGLRSIVIYMSREDDVFAAIPRHLGTHLMNALSADLLVVAYPALSLLNRSLYPFVMPPDYLQRQMGSYSLRGVTGVFRGSDLEDLSGGCWGSVLCAKTDRKVGDDETMVVQIGRGNMVKDFQRVRSSVAYWRLGGKECGNSECFLPIVHAAADL